MADLHRTDTGDVAELTFEEVQVQSMRRLARWHGPDTVPWTLADWSNAMCGEAGEAANVVKKIRRHQTGTASDRDPSLASLQQMLSNELGDVVAYAAILADAAGIDLGVAVAEKFNAVSIREGHAQRLPVPTRPQPCGVCEDGCVPGTNHPCPRCRGRMVFPPIGGIATPPVEQCACAAHVDADADCTCSCPLYTHVGDTSDDGWGAR